LSDKLLNTAEAAAYLRVSQASVRRWSDSGLLRARRVGRRRERRFTEADLKGFLAPSASSSGPHAPAIAAQVLIGGSHVPLHSHLATFYNSDEGRLRLPIPFFRDGLLLGQPCFLAASREVLDAYMAALRREVAIDVDAAVRDGLLTVVDGPGTTVEGALNFWEDSLSKAILGGPTLLRVVGEMAMERSGFGSDAEMLRYEVAYNMIARRFPVVTLCQYDVRAFDGEMVFHALRAHPDLYEMGIAALLN
jgi:excisionase family DNA binding protein